MKKFAIIEKSTGTVLHIYEADTSSISKFGGQWGDFNQVEHIEVPNDLESEPASNLLPDMVQVQVGTNRELCRCNQGLPIKKQAYDSEGNPILDQSGNPVELDTYIDVPIYETVKSLRKRH